MQPYQPPPGWSPFGILVGMVKGIIEVLSKLPASTLVGLVALVLISIALSVINHRKDARRRGR